MQNGLLKLIFSFPHNECGQNTQIKVHFLRFPHIVLYCVSLICHPNLVPCCPLVDGPSGRVLSPSALVATGDGSCAFPRQVFLLHHLSPHDGCASQWGSKGCSLICPAVGFHPVGDTNHLLTHCVLFSCIHCGQWLLRTWIAPSTVPAESEPLFLLTAT